MRLGLVDWPFVPHNLISARESSVPLPKFLRVPRFKILMSSGSKKKEPRYTILFSQESQQENPLQVPHRGPYGDRETRLQGIFMSLLIYLFLSFPQSPLHVP